MKNEMVDALNKQITQELTASYAYLAMSLYMEAEHLPGFATWMNLQSEEERAHARIIIDYVNDRSGLVVLESIPKPAYSFNSVREVFEVAMGHEKANTASINNLYQLAKEIYDYTTQAKLQWFLAEQVEEEKTVVDILGQLRLADSDPSALLYLDRTMAARGAAT